MGAPQATEASTSFVVLRSVLTALNVQFYRAGGHPRPSVSTVVPQNKSIRSLSKWPFFVMGDEEGRRVCARAPGLCVRNVHRDACVGAVSCQIAVILLDSGFIYCNSLHLST